MQLSHSKIETYVKCPYLFKLRYIDNLTTLPTDDPANPLILGKCLHTGIEKDNQTAIDEYYDSFPAITDKHIDEAIKLEYWIPKVKKLLPEGINEVKIEDKDFIGFIDYLVPITSEKRSITTELKDNHEDGYDEVIVDRGNTEVIGELIEPAVYDLYDFKYSNNIDSYLKSDQLHLYKYYYEKMNKQAKIRNLYFVFIPKSQLRIKYKNKTNPRDETIYEFRQRIIEDLKSKEIQIVKIDYRPEKVIEFLTNAKHCIEDITYQKNESRLCEFCEFKKYCQDGIEYEIVKGENI